MTRRLASPATLSAQRKLQIALGLIWLIDGALQLQPFMFSRAFVTQVIAPNEIGQPGFVGGPIRFAAHMIEPRVVLFNVFAVVIQLLIGVGLLYRPTVKAALLTSFGWALGVWWFGEGLGGLFTGAASPLTGAPGAALLYVFAGLLAWPRARGGPLRERGATWAWALLWLGSAALWLMPANRAGGAFRDAAANAPSGAGWLSSIHASVATATAGDGAAIAVVAAGLSIAVCLAVLSGRWAKPALALSALVALVYFIIGQGMGGLLTGSGTDPGTGPLLLLLAFAIYPIHRARRPRTRLREQTSGRARRPSPSVATSPSQSLAASPSRSAN